MCVIRWKCAYSCWCCPGNIDLVTDQNGYLLIAPRCPIDCFNFGHCKGQNMLFVSTKNIKTHWIIMDTRVKNLVTHHLWNNHSKLHLFLFLSETGFSSHGFETHLCQSSILYHMYCRPSVNLLVYVCTLKIFLQLSCICWASRWLIL